MKIFNFKFLIFNRQLKGAKALSSLASLKLWRSGLALSSSSLSLRTQSSESNDSPNQSKGLALSGPKGFTLVELLLYMGLFTVLLGVFVQLFASLVSTQLESQSTSSISEDAKYVLARMSYDISQAQNISSPALGVSSSTLQFTVNNATYTYASSSGNLVLTTPSSSSQLNGSDTTISSLSFTPVGSSSGKFTIEVALTLKSTTVRGGNNIETESIQTTLGNR